MRFVSEGSLARLPFFNASTTHYSSVLWEETSVLKSSKVTTKPSPQLRIEP